MTETANSSTETLSDDYRAELASLSDRELLERLSVQLFHSDTMLHEVHQLVTEHRPLLAMLKRRLDSGSKWKGWPGAVRQDGPQSLQVAVRPPVHGPAGPRLLRDARLEAQAEEA